MCVDGVSLHWCASRQSRFFFFFPQDNTRNVEWWIGDVSEDVMRNRPSPSLVLLQVSEAHVAMVTKSKSVKHRDVALQCTFGFAPLNSIIYAVLVCISLFFT